LITVLSQDNATPVETLVNIVNNTQFNFKD